MTAKMPAITQMRNPEAVVSFILVHPQIRARGAAAHTQGWMPNLISIAPHAAASILGAGH